MCVSDTFRGNTGDSVGSTIAFSFGLESDSFYCIDSELVG